MKHRFRPYVYRVGLVALVVLSAGCMLMPEPKQGGKPKPPKVSDEHADKVVAAATAVLGHDQFSVCYVEDQSVFGADTSLQNLVGLGGLGASKNDIVKGMAAGFADNQKRGLDVVMDGPEPGKSDHLARQSLELLKQPLPGLDLVLLRSPSPGLQAAAQKYGVTLHVITVK